LTKTTHPLLLLPVIFLYFLSKMKDYFLFLDLETVGGSVCDTAITQVASTLWDAEKKITVEFETLVKCKRPISKFIQRLTHIKPDMLVDAPNIREALEKWITWIKNHVCDSRKVQMVAYKGATFDFPLMIHSLEKAFPERNGISMLQECGIYRAIDPLVWARAHTDFDNRSWPQTPKGNTSFKLGDVYKGLFGSVFPNAHNALADSHALQRICQHKTFHEPCLFGSQTTDDWCDDLMTCKRKLSTMEEKFVKKKQANRRCQGKSLVSKHSRTKKTKKSCGYK
jgi:DNA polymerase III alpha subunit (gram-positive type)